MNDKKFAKWKKEIYEDIMRASKRKDIEVRVTKRTWGALMFWMGALTIMEQGGVITKEQKDEVDDYITLPLKKIHWKNKMRNKK